MAVTTFNWTMTTAGLNLLAENIYAIGDLKAVTRLSLGSGNYTPTAGQTALTSPFSPAIDLTTPSIAGAGSGTVTLAFAYENPPNSVSVGEVGLFIGDTLIQIASRTSAQGGNFLDITAGEGVQFNLTLRLLTTTSPSSLTYTPDLVLAGASQSAWGTVELATNAEAAAGTDTGRAVTPASAKYAWDQLKANITEALDKNDNTNWVTPERLFRIAVQVQGERYVRYTAAGSYNLVVPTGATAARLRITGGAGGGGGGSGAASVGGTATNVVTQGSGGSGGAGNGTGATGSAGATGVVSSFTQMGVPINTQGGNAGGGGGGGDNGDLSSVTIGGTTYSADGGDGGIGVTGMNGGAGVDYSHSQITPRALGGAGGAGGAMPNKNGLGVDGDNTGGASGSVGVVTSSVSQHRRQRLAVITDANRGKPGKLRELTAAVTAGSTIAIVVGDGGGGGSAGGNANGPTGRTLGTAGSAGSAGGAGSVEIEFLY